MGGSEKFEYHTLLFYYDHNDEDMRRQLNQFGAQGWELVAVFEKGDLPKFVFKRALEQ